MKLWTFQSNQSIEQLERKGILVALQNRYNNTSPWRMSYNWMANQMKKRGIDCHGNLAIWAWHSCGKSKHSPTLGDARALLSDLEIDDGIQTIELECPDKFILLSNYGTWNIILDLFMDNKIHTKIDNSQVEALFNINLEQLEADDAIQATLPLLKKEWIIDIRALNLEADNFDYDPKELV